MVEKMEARNFKIDINRLHDGHLNQSAAMFYELGEMEKVQQINKRIAFLRGWTDKED